MGNGVEQIVDARAMDQIQLAQCIEGQALAVMMLCFVEQLDGRPLVQFGVDLAQMADHRRLVVVRGRNAAAASDVGNCTCPAARPSISVIGPV